MKFIGYYTENTPYKNVIESCLIPTLKQHGLDYYIEAVPDLGNWYINTEYKATFIKNCLMKFKQDIVFNDADSRIVKYPQLFFDIPEKYDIAVCYLDWFLQWRNQTGQGQFELLSGTMMFRYNQTVLDLCDRYIKKCGEVERKLEQKVLEGLVEESPELKVYKLPPEYCAVVKHDKKVPKYIKDPVIVHHQASRNFKRWSKQ